MNTTTTHTPGDILRRVGLNTLFPPNQDKTYKAKDLQEFLRKEYGMPMHAIYRYMAFNFQEGSGPIYGFEDLTPEAQTDWAAGY